MKNLRGKTTRKKHDRSAYAKAYRAKNKKKLTAYLRRWYLKNKKHQNEKSQRWAKQNALRTRWYNAKSKYGLTFSEYCSLIKQKCAICGKKSKHIDHNHTTGAVRAALCRTCNVGLGHFHESKVLLMAAIRYLNKHQ